MTVEIEARSYRAARLLLDHPDQAEKLLGIGEKGLAREERLQIMLSPKELEAVDNFRFQHRMPSRPAAVRELLRYGIANVGAVLENAGIASGDYGVLKAPKGLGPERKSKS